MTDRPEPTTNFDDKTDDGLRDHLLACSDWLLDHDDRAVAASYLAGRAVLQQRIAAASVRANMLRAALAKR